MPKQNDPSSFLSPNEKPLSEAEWEILLNQKLKKEFIGLIERERPDPEYFVDVDENTPEKIDRDLNAVKEVKERFEREKGDRALLGEALLYYAINKKGLLGKNVEAIAASEYDDIKRGVDFVIQFKANGKLTWVAVDISTADSEIIEKKRENIEEWLDRGRLAELKYFQTEPDEEPKEEVKLKGLVRMPKVVIALSQEEINLMAKTLPKGALPVEELRQKVFKQLIDQLLTDLDRVESGHTEPTRKEFLVRTYENAIHSISPSSSKVAL